MPKIDLIHFNGIGSPIWRQPLISRGNIGTDAFEKVQNILPLASAAAVEA